MTLGARSLVVALAVAGGVLLAGCEPTAAAQPEPSSSATPPAPLVAATTPAPRVTPTPSRSRTPSPTATSEAATPTPAAPPTPVAAPLPPAPAALPEPATTYYANCTAVRAAGKAPLLRGDPGYSTKLDRDGDGIACE